jgi:hypothetical protein
VFRIALPTVAILTGLGFSSISSINFRAHIKVAANRIANFLTSVMGGSALGFAAENGNRIISWILFAVLIVRNDD